ncbi:MAG: Ig-like domain repeat protein, partial [Acidimicrobiales bacterium]
THTLTFDANAGIDLGPAAATAEVLTGGNVTSTSSTNVDVIDGEEPQINNPSTAVALTPGVLDSSQTSQGDLNIGYLTSPEDLNDWSVNVAQGAELSVALTNLPATYDLELFGPGSAQLQGSPDQTIGGVTDTVPSLDSSTTSEATPGSDDLATTPPAGDVLEAISNNPDSQSQYIQTTPLQAGTYIIQVSGYNGAYSSDPYLLQANVIGGETEPSCPDGVSYLSSLGSPASGPVNVPNGANTLFLVDTQRLTAAFGQSAEEDIMSDLQSVAADSSAGVTGAIVPVDSYSSVQSAYSTWDQNPCSVNAANGVVQSISSVVDQIRASDPSAQNVVIVGADDQIPFARVADGATESNERDYGQSTFAGENNPEADLLSLGYYMSDDPYVSATPLGVGSATLYLPQLAVGRLVESASEIEGSLMRFVSTGGDLDASASLTTGYSFLTSGADAVSANLKTDGLTPSTLIDETWQESDLDEALAASPTPGVDSINAHFDYSRALPAYDNTNNIETNLFTTTDVRTPPDPTSYAGRLLFSMGCHSGLDVDDAEVSTSGVSTPVDDWAKTFADEGALWVANTGYGYADTDTIAYSAKLMAEFAGNLNGSYTIGEALSEAKQQYAADNAILSPYDLKALMESTLYGLPMYHLNSLGDPVTPPTGPATQTDPATGLPSASVSISLNGGSASGDLGLVHTSDGSYYQVNGTNTQPPGTQTTEFRPIEPLATVPVTEPNLVPHGALVTGLESTDTNNFKPAFSLPAVGSSDDSLSSVGNSAFPGTLQRVATYGTFTSTGTSTGANLDLIVGQFIPNQNTPGTGVQRIFSSESATVLYDSPTSALADDYTPATIDSSQGIRSPQSEHFQVQVTPSSSADPVLEVTVLYTDSTHPGTWTSATLTSDDGGISWTGSGPATTTGMIQYIVQAVDSAGNVAISNNEGADFNGSAQPAISISLSGSSVVNGYYTGPVTATITAPPGSSYTLDGPTVQSVPSNWIIQITGQGPHTLTVFDQQGDTTTQTISISNYQTTTQITSSDNPSLINSQFSLIATVQPATSGSGSPTGTVEFFDGTTPIGACNGASGEPVDLDGTATCNLSYSEMGTHQMSAAYSGDNTYAESSSGPLSESITAVGTATKLSTSTDPVKVGGAVTLTATVATTGAGNKPRSGSPTGNVEFINGGTPMASCGAATGVKLSKAGTAQCRFSSRATGGNNIIAVYLGSGSFTSSTSKLLTEVVTTSSCTSFMDCNLSGLDLAGANLAGVNLGCANLKGADLAGANLDGAIINEADLQKADLMGASAVRANLSKDNLKNANLSYVNFTKADLDDSNLTGANTTGANFTGAKRKGITT